MISDYQQIELLGKGIFRKVVLKPPYRVLGKMPEEVCFFLYGEWQICMVSTQ